MRRHLTDKISLNQTFYYRNRSSIPLGHQLDVLAKRYSLGLTGVDFEHINVDLSQIGVKGYSPELRFYLGKHKNPVFLGFFGQFERIDAIIPASFEMQYEGNNFLLEKVPINFDIRSSSGGILIGKKFNFTENIKLDVIIIGPHIGSAQKVYAVVEQELLNRLSDTDKDYMRAKIIERFNLSENYYNVSISDTKAEINAFRKVPYLGIRAVGLNLGFAF